MSPSWRRRPSVLLRLVGLTLLALQLGQAAAQKQPNIIIVIIDDAGIDDVGYSASPESPIRGKTPVIDSLANEGVRLKEYYAHPVCTPTRASLLTGLYAHNTGLPFPLLAHPVGGIPDNVPVMAEVLKSGGYKTHMVGKWHIGNAKKSMLPLSRGFDTFFGLHAGGFDHYTKDGGNAIDLWRGWEQIQPEEIDVTDHATNLFSREAIRVIHEHAESDPDSPFFMYLSYTAPHDPLQADPEYVDKCKGIVNKKRRDFCGMMAQLDDGIHNVTKALKDTGLWDNTVVLFTSDNGGNPLVGGQNYPFRGIKSTAWEGGSRVPGFIVAPPRFNFKPRDYSGMVHVADWMPTFLGMARIRGPKRTDGHDLKDVLASDTLNDSPRTSVVIQHDVFLNSSAYRSGCMKLVLGCPGGRTLYMEPDHRLMIGVKEDDHYMWELLGFWLIERSFSVIEALVPAPFDQFLKYMITVNQASIRDWRQGTSYNHILNKQFQNMSIWKANLTETPPLLDWSLEHGPRATLYDVCKDPSEKTNLATTSEGKEIATRLFNEFTETLKDAPLQFAGDTIDETHCQRGRAQVAPFLPDEQDIASLTTVNDRLFALLDRLFTGLFRLLILLSVLSCVVMWLILWRCCFRQRQRRKYKQG